MPEHFAYPADASLAAWVPLSVLGPESIGRVRGARFQGVVARLAAGASAEQLQAELNGIVSRIAAEFPENRGWVSVSVSSLRTSIVGDVSRPLTLVFGGVLLVLLIACANVAGLLLARATARQRELAVRAALGAGRGRITRQLLTESVVLALGGGALGVLLALWTLRAIGASDLGVPRADLVRIDAPVLLFAVALSLVAGALFGVLPSLRATGASLIGALRAGTSGSVGVGGQLRQLLVVAQVALAVMLVTAAALTTKSFARLQAVDLGFNPDQALFVEMSVGDRYETDVANRAYYQAVLDAIAEVPGVAAVGAIRDLPTRGMGESGTVRIAGVTDTPETRPLAQFHQVSRDYFRAMQIPLRRGRAFAAADRMDAPPVAIVDEEFARRNFPDDDPTTHALRFGETDVPIIGVVASVRQGGAAEPFAPTVYLHAQQSFRRRMSIVVRTAGEPLALADAVRQAIWRVDEQQTITSVATLDDVMGRSVSRPRLLASLFAMFGALGLTLGALGVYGVLAFGVTQRRPEIGVRMALGASPGSVRRMVVRQGLVLAVAGVAIGVLGAIAMTRSIQSVLYDVQALDVSTLVQVALVVVGAALLASWLPARRATSIDPAVALRSD